MRRRFLAAVDERTVRGGHVRREHRVHAQRDTGLDGAVGALQLRRVRNARLVCGLGHLRRPELGGHVDEHRVDGLGHRLADAAVGRNIALHPGSVVELGTGDHLLSRAVVELADALALLQPGDRHERFERRTRLLRRAGPVEVADLGLGTVVRLDPATVGVDRDQRRAQRFGLGAHHVLHGLLGLLLRVRVDGGLDRVAAEGQLALGQALGLQFFAHPLPDGVLGGGEPAVGLPLRAGPGGRQGQGLPLTRLQEAVLLHLPDDVLPALLALLGVLAGVVAAVRALDHAGQHGRFGVVELARLLVEVRPRGGADAVGTAPVVRSVHVGEQDVVLALLVRHLVRQHDFLDLADVRRVLLQPLVHLDELLGDRGATADAGAAHQVVGRPHDAHEVEAGVRAERGVLGRDGGVAHRHRHLVDVVQDLPRAVHLDAAHRCAVGVLQLDRPGRAHHLGLIRHVPGEVAVDEHRGR